MSTNIDQRPDRDLEDTVPTNSNASNDLSNKAVTADGPTDRDPVDDAEWAADSFDEGRNGPGND